MDEQARKSAARAKQLLIEQGEKLTPQQQEALAYLVDYVKGNPDTPPQLWHCDIDCRHRMNSSCAGRYGRTYGTAPLCPYFENMLH